MIGDFRYVPQSNKQVAKHQTLHVGVSGVSIVEGALLHFFLGRVFQSFNLGCPFSDPLPNC